MGQLLGQQRLSEICMFSWLEAGESHADQQPWSLCRKQSQGPGHEVFLEFTVNPKEFPHVWNQFHLRSCMMGICGATLDVLKVSFTSLLFSGRSVLINVDMIVSWSWQSYLGRLHVSATLSITMSVTLSVTYVARPP